jgi:hypothetical protein
MNRLNYLVVALFLVCGAPSTALAWTLAYAHDRDGAPTSGDLGVLINGVRNGKEVRVLINDSYATSAQNLWAANGKVYMQNTTHVSTEFVGDVLTFQDDAYHWFIIVDTDGNRSMSRWFVGEHTAVGANLDRVSIKWFVQ